MIESFWSTMQCEFLDRRRWDTKAQLSQAIFEWIEAWYNPRRHTSIGDLAPVAYSNARLPAIRPLSAVVVDPTTAAQAAGR